MFIFPLLIMRLIAILQKLVLPLLPESRMPSGRKFRNSLCIKSGRSFGS